MRCPIFFIGGRDRGFLALESMIESGEQIVGACIMQEDLHEPEHYFKKIHTLLEEKNIPYLSTNSVKNKKYISFIRKTDPKLMIVVGWRSIIPAEIINLPPMGIVAIHESLLPKYRGFAPVNWVVINGETETGVSLFYLDTGVDNGDIVAQTKIPISEDATATDIYRKTTHASIALLNKYLPLLKKNIAPRKKQKERDATYTCARIPDDGIINWNNSYISIYNLIRGLSYPYTGAFTKLSGKKLFIWKASIPIQKKYIGRVPGRIVSILKGKGIEVLTGDGSLLIEEVQFDKKQRVNASEVIFSIRLSFDSFH